MCTNIDTDAALKAIHNHILANQARFPTLPLTPLMEALEMLMKRDFFQFGDTFWLQLTGAAMGAPLAPTTATISCGTHEEFIIDEFKDFLGFYKCHIDDVSGIWMCHPDPVVDQGRWRPLKHHLNDWHDLEWIVRERSDEVAFLDLTS